MNDYGASAMFHADVFFAYFQPCRPDAISRDEFLDDYWIQPSASAFVALQTLDAHHVWTIVTDGYSRDVYYTTGFHIVNREGYIVTERAHSFDMLDFRASWRRPFLSEIGLKREIKKLEVFLQCNS